MVFARTIVGAGDVPHPVARMHDELFDTDPVPVDRIAGHLKNCVDILIDWRKRMLPIIAKRMAVEPVLDDPTNADHPARALWIAQYDQLIDQECEHLVHVLWEAYHIGRLWDALSVQHRVSHELHTLLGIDARATNVGRFLAFADRGPIQRAATLPPKYQHPEGLHHLLPTNVALMIDVCPF
jgi:hypothetical protein